jgi:CO/xanthine dehydrogenase Mo-binding subunit
MKVRGIGIGAMLYGIGYGFSRPDFSVAELELAADGSLTVWVGASELGQGLRTVLSQIAAESLALPYEDVRIISSDTEKTPDSGGVSASRATYVHGNAVVDAARDLRGPLSVLAGELLGVDPVKLEFADGLVIDRAGSALSISIKELAGEMHKRGRRVRGVGRYDNTTADVDPETSQGDAFATHAWASQLVEVEVDAETGVVKVLRLASATDAGKAINPKLAEGQIEGGAVQGLGFALMEQMQVEQGVFKNASLTNYLIPTAADVPPIDALIVEVPDPRGPYGAKGIGEPATIPTAPAILNAIADAIGKRLRQTPASPENVLIALGELSPDKPEFSKADIPYPPA